MAGVRDLVGQPLQWVRPEMLTRAYELRNGDVRVGTLRFRSMLGTLALAETADGCWSFKRVGFLQTRVTIRSCETEADIATFKHLGWRGGGVLELPEGRRYPANTNRWMTTYQFTSAAGEPLIRFSRKGGLSFTPSKVEIQPAAARVAELPLLVALGWYLSVLMQDDAAIAAAV